MSSRENFNWRSRLLCIAAEKHLLSPYLDDELDAATRAQVANHLKTCARCQAEFEQMRFASNAMAHFHLPVASNSLESEVWSLKSSVSRRNIADVRRRKFMPFVSKIFASSISVPTPLVIGALIVMFASLFYAMRFAARTSSASDTAALPLTKIIEIPIERETTREHIVTRTVYVERTRATIKHQKRLPSFNQPNESNVPRRSSESMRGVSLAGFHPATDANLRIVKESEQ